MANSRKQKLTMRHTRLRKKLTGTLQRPRLSVHFSGRHIYAQIIDDHCGKTITSVNTTEIVIKSKLPKANLSTASMVGALLAERALSSNVSQVVFDRGGFIYHGKVKALADSARAAGLKF